MVIIKSEKSLVVCCAAQQAEVSARRQLSLTLSAARTTALTQQRTNGGLTSNMQRDLAKN
jgi:hypothetical protein